MRADQVDITNGTTGVTRFCQRAPKADTPRAADAFVPNSDSVQILTNHPFVDAFIWFDLDKERNWLIDSDGSWAPRDALSDTYFDSGGNPGSGRDD